MQVKGPGSASRDAQQLMLITNVTISVSRNRCAGVIGGARINVGKNSFVNLVVDVTRSQFVNGANAPGWLIEE